VWDDIYRSPEVDCKITEVVEAWISNGMCGEPPWAPNNEDIENVGFEVEHLIFD